MLGGPVPCLPRHTVSSRVVERHLGSGLASLPCVSQQRGPRFGFWILGPTSMDKDSVDMHQELTALKTKFQEMRKVISTMPGINSSPEQQQQQLQSLREQVRTKNELLQKYKSLCMFEIPKE